MDTLYRGPHPKHHYSRISTGNLVGNLHSMLPQSLHLHTLITIPHTNMAHTSIQVSPITIVIIHITTSVLLPLAQVRKKFFKKKQVELGMPKKGWKQDAEVRRNALLHP